MHPCQPGWSPSCPRRRLTRACGRMSKTADAVVLAAPPPSSRYVPVVRQGPARTGPRAARRGTRARLEHGTDTSRRFYRRTLQPPAQDRICIGSSFLFSKAVKTSLSSVLASHSAVVRWSDEWQFFGSYGAHEGLRSTCLVRAVLMDPGLCQQEEDFEDSLFRYGRAPVLSEKRL